MGTKLLLLLLLQLLLISLASAGLRHKWRPRVSQSKLPGKGDYQILSRRSQPERFPWKPPYNRRG